METVQVIGAGFMGAGIAQVAAQSGRRVFLTESNEQSLDKALAGLRWSLGKLASKGLLRDSAEEVFGRITPSPDLSPAAEADVAIEAVFEKESLKKEIFQELDRLARPDAILASNTSSIPITRLAAVVARPERVVGLHFFGPVPFMGLVEVVKGEKTSEEYFQRSVDFVTSLGKTPVKVKQDIPLFVMNRIFGAAFSEAAELVEKGVASPEDVDLGMRLGYGWNVGPFEIADNAGLDTWLLIARAVRELGAGDIFRSEKLIEKMVAQGRLGRKVGQGFYRYTADGKKVPFESQD
ncbi:MAG: 3-hydroxyacyl-CoA dehydrogenase family protein [Pseudomonadota bacterium]